MILIVFAVHAGISGSLCKQNEPAHMENRQSQEPGSVTKNAREMIISEFNHFLQLAIADQSFEQWSKKNNARCESDGYTMEWDPAQMWCSKCTLEGHSWQAEYMFHPDLDKGMCTLQQVRVTGNSLDEIMLADIAKKIEAVLGKGTFVPANKKEHKDNSKWNWKSERNNAYLFLMPADESRYSEEENEEQDDSINHENVPRISFTWIKSPLLHFNTLIENFKEDRDDWKIEKREEIDLCYQACLEAKLTGCKESYEALEHYNGFAIGDIYQKRLDYSQIFYDALIEALVKLNKTDKSAQAYPAIVYWMDLLAREQCRFQETTEDWKQKEKILQRYGLQYSSSHSTSCYLVRNHFSYIALKRQDSKWGKRAFLERSGENWSSDRLGGVDALPGYGTLQELKEIIRRDEEFLKKFPESEISGDVIHHLAYSYDALWSMSLAEIRDDRQKENPEWLNDSEKARLIAIELFRKYLEKYSDKKDEMNIIIDRYELFKLERKIDTHADYRPGSC